MIRYMTTTTYTIAAKPKNADMTEFDCHFCAHLDLAKPVFITDGSSVYAAGSGCAAKMVFGDDRPTYVAKVRKAAELMNYEVAQHEAVRTELMERAVKALADFNAGVGYSPELQSMRVLFHKNNTGETFPEFMTNVATTGDIK